MWRYDANANGTVASTERYHYMYDDRWRVVGVFRDADSTPKESFVYHAAGNAGRGSSSYIDSVILRDRDANGGGGWTGASDGTLEERRFYVQNWRADVVAMAKSDGTPLEYVFYSAYGEATVHPIADVDMDGDVDSYDAAAWDNGENLGLAYNYVPANTDLNWDGTEDAADDALFDESYAANVGLSGKGRMSSVGVGNRKGYAGYEHDESIAMYHVRHRVYRADLGRWMTRDPLGYVDGMSLYEYVGGMAIVGRDSSGLARAICASGACQPTFDPSYPPLVPIEPSWMGCANKSTSFANCFVCCQGSGNGSCMQYCKRKFLYITPPPNDREGPPTRDELACQKACDRHNPNGILDTAGVNTCSAGRAIACVCANTPIVPGGGRGEPTDSLRQKLNACYGIQEMMLPDGLDCTNLGDGEDPAYPRLNVDRAAYCRYLANKCMGLRMARDCFEFISCNDEPQESRNACNDRVKKEKLMVEKGIHEYCVVFPQRNCQ
jgi:RHS repeat-associated protein